MAGPDDKKSTTSRMSAYQEKKVRRLSKAYDATGAVPPAHKTVGNGEQNLATRRIWRWLMGDDE